MAQRIYTRIREAASAFWQWLRGASGDHAYECYLRYAAKHSEPVLTAEEFYLDNERRKSSRQSRCC